MNTNEPLREYPLIRALLGQGPQEVKAAQGRNPVKRRKYNMAMAQAHVNVLDKANTFGKIFHGAAFLVRRLRSL